ncbi:KICSTOR complex protein kaptin-like [Ylistrum balloti]|uniref:KICSTOR complex protein kaptin-like n=1 Tax=Ylistrum balloti TaxID=509963 RepID=UPI002905E24F|nr:KICSTOR complex protein kaptin-like [Ylistrum balloti]
MDQRGWRWTDAHFCSLPSQAALYGITATPQTNVYTHAKVIEPEGSNKLLVASLRGKIVSVEYQRNGNKLKPSTKEVQFTYIPGDAELVSLDVAARTSQQGNGLLIGITFLKQTQTEDGEHTCMQYLNLYSFCQSDEDSHYVDSVAQTCVTLELDFMPYQLIHTECVTEDGLETVFLLSGNDQKVHMYREDHVAPVLRFKEEEIENYFPELCCPGSSVHWMDLVYIDNHKKRLTAQGQQNGQVFVSLVDVSNTEVLKGWEGVFDSPITCVKIFNPDNQVSFPEFLRDIEGKDNSIQEDTPAMYNLLVMSSLEPTVVYRNILTNGLDNALYLPGSCCYDIPLCACVADIDFDGYNEILVGTYGQELLAYKLMQEDDQIPILNKSPSLTKNKMSSPANINSYTDGEPVTSPRQRHLTGSGHSGRDSPLAIKLPRKAKSQENLCSSLPKNHDTGTKQELSEVDLNVTDRKLCYKLLWQRSFASPVVGVDRVDIMGDGMDDMVVVTLRGVHVIQPELREVAQVCLEQLRNLVSSKESSEDDDEQIQLNIDNQLTKPNRSFETNT